MITTEDAINIFKSAGGVLRTKEAIEAGINQKTLQAHKMTDNFLQKTGQCRCGQIQFTVHSEPLITMACHCTGCQRMTGSAFSLSALYASDEFNITSGEPVIGGMHGTTRHYFCAHCMSWLFTRPEGIYKLMNVRATLLLL